ncbi:MAG: hypothetical protein ACKOCT_12310, partial [Alphaproteobacteria bacterium]
MSRRPPRILTPRRFNRALAAAILAAALLHVLAIVAATFLGGFRLRPESAGETYTVEMFDGGE